MAAIERSGLGSRLALILLCLAIPKCLSWTRMTNIVVSSDSKVFRCTRCTRVVRYTHSSNILPPSLVHAMAPHGWWVKRHNKRSTVMRSSLLANKSPSARDTHISLPSGLLIRLSIQRKQLHRRVDPVGFGSPSLAPCECRQRRRFVKRGVSSRLNSGSRDPPRLNKTELVICCLKSEMWSQIDFKEGDGRNTQAAIFNKRRNKKVDQKGCNPMVAVRN